MGVDWQFPGNDYGILNGIGEAGIVQAGSGRIREFLFIWPDDTGI